MQLLLLHSLNISISCSEAMCEVPTPTLWRETLKFLNHHLLVELLNELVELLHPARLCRVNEGYTELYDQFS